MLFLPIILTIPIKLNSSQWICELSLSPIFTEPFFTEIAAATAFKAVYYSKHDLNMNWGIRTCAKLKHSLKAHYQLNFVSYFIFIRRQWEILSIRTRPNFLYSIKSFSFQWKSDIFMLPRWSNYTWLHKLFSEDEGKKS